MDAAPAQSSTPSPAATYYRACIGGWRGTMDLIIVDRHAMVAAMGRANALAWWAIARWPGWLGRPRFETSVREVDPTTFEHTSALCWGPIALMRSVERMSVGADGRAFTLAGRSRTVLGIKHDISGRGEVDAAGFGATYTITWMGAEFAQTGARTDIGVTLTQAGPGFSAQQRLSRNP